ncbi:MAG TPA: NAD(P)-dependent oxidoreductase [Candidatus Acidoferrales bacterium]|nr:NAD(P)-dependent oxidoreductase [Candidatus Acidoferrales bacterium]
MAKAKVFVFAPADPTGQAHKMLEDAGCELVLGKANWDTPQGNNELEMMKMAEGCDAMMGTSIRSTPITQKIMQSSSRLRIVAKFTIGVDDVDVDAATELGILVTHAPTESNWGGVAEGTIANMLALLKKTRERDRYLKTTSGWRNLEYQGTYVGSRAEDGYPGIVIGIIGLGRIGSRVAKLMRPWGMRMIGYDPYVPDAKFQEFGVERVHDLDTLLRQSDVVTLHVVLTKETRHMIGARELSLMKPTAILVNTSRGFCVDEKALIEALQQKKIAGAALDVFEYEPLAADSPLRKMDDRVLLSPHMVSSNLGSGLKTGLLWGTRSVLAALRGEIPDNVYNQEVLEQWQSRFGGKNLLA